jgi:hypothetical protein
MKTGFVVLLKAKFNYFYIVKKKIVTFKVSVRFIIEFRSKDTHDQRRV